MNNSLTSILEILLITYNRSACLDNTLRQLSESPFAQCRLTVLDNCSTDDTPNVIASYKNQFTNYRIIRHHMNIGGDYNFLRAVELSTSYYTWILCDDDNYDFSRADEVITAIESKSFYLIYTKSRITDDALDWSGYGATTVKKLIKDNARYHTACTFWPSFVFRTDRWVDECFYDAPYLFPSMKFINRSVKFDFSIYVPKAGIVIRSTVTAISDTPLHFYKEWVENASQISDRKLRAYVIEQWTDKGFLKTLAFWIAVDRSKKANGYWKRLVDIMFALTPAQKIRFLMLFPLMLIPLPIQFLIRAREFVYRLMGQKDASMLPPVDAEHR